MEELSFEQKLKIRDYFDDPNYPQPHGEVIATQLLAAMIASGKYELDEYPRLLEAAIKLTALLVTRFDDQMSSLRELRRDDDDPKPPASEKKDLLNSDSDSEALNPDYDPIPF